MADSIYDQRDVAVKKNGGPINILITLEDKGSEDGLMTFSSTSQWTFYPGGTDKDRSRPNDSDSLDDLQTLIKLGTRANQHDCSRVDIAVGCGKLVDGDHTYAVKMVVSQNGKTVDTFETEDRTFKDADVFTTSFLFLN